MPRSPELPLELELAADELPAAAVADVEARTAGAAAAGGDEGAQGGRGGAGPHRLAGHSEELLALDVVARKLLHHAFGRPFGRRVGGVSHRVSFV